MVGSGAGGATVAASLTRGGASVTIVEAGAWREPKDYPESTYGAFRDMLPDWGALLTWGRAFWPVVQGRTVGGTTVINSAIAVRTPGDVFADWERDFGFGGDALAEKIWGFQETLEEELYVEEVPENAIGKSSKLAHETAQELGWESHAMHRYTRGCEGAGQCFQGCKRGRKQSTNLNFVPEVLQKGGSVLSCAPVRRILFEGSRAVGVTGHFVHPQTKRKGGTFEIRARKAVIVAASATYSPILLQASKIRNKALGRYFRAHPGTSTLGIYDDPIDMNKGATQGWASIAFRESVGMKLESLALPPGMVASRLAGAGPELMERLQDYRHLAMWVLAVRAEAHGVVRRDPFGKPMVRYTMTRADMKRLRSGLVHLAKLHFAAGAKWFIPCTHGLPYKISRDQIHLVENAPLDPRCYLGVLSHLFGGCVMGTNPDTSVCDPRGRVHGYEGLVIADASAIPGTLGVNPQHTIMALSRLRAEELLAEA